PLQEGILFHSLYDGGVSDVYTSRIRLDLEGPLDEAALRTAWRKLLQRHTGLRSAFVRDGSARGPVQVVLPAIDVPWHSADLTALDADGQHTELARIAQWTSPEHFDLTTPPLLRIAVVRLSPQRHRVLLSNHHIILDGWSMQVLLRELFTLYADETAELPRIAPYRDYLGWLAAQDHEASHTAWNDALEGLQTPTLVAPHATPGQVSDVRETEIEVDSTTAETLRAFGRRHGLTLNTLVQGAWALTLARLTGGHDLVFGATVSGRPAELPGVESMAGLFINTLPVRVTLDPGTTVLDMLQRLQEQQSQLADHHHLGLNDITRQTGLDQLFDTILVFENYPVDPARLTPSPELRITDWHWQDATHYPLALLVIPDDRPKLRVQWQPALLGEETGTELATHLIRLLTTLTTDPGQHLATIELTTPQEREHALTTWNDTAVDQPRATLRELLRAQAAHTPDAQAVVFEDHTLTYAQL
ncbi:condensation domain-containing protein, partial [Streptomyces sp. NPDC057271]